MRGRSTTPSCLHPTGPWSVYARQKYNPVLSPPYPLTRNPPIFRSVVTPLSGIHQYFALLLPLYRESTNISLCCYPFIGNPPIFRSVVTPLSGIHQYFALLLPPYRESTNIAICCYPFIGNPPILRSVVTPLSGIHQYCDLLLPLYRESTSISLCCYPFIGNPPILRSVATLSLVRKLWRPLCGLFVQNNDCDVLIG